MVGLGQPKSDTTKAFVCRFCKGSFDRLENLKKHVQQIHQVTPDKNPRVCSVCGVYCLKYDGYLQHLFHLHGLAKEGQVFTFKALNDFYAWKDGLEKRNSCKFILKNTKKLLNNNKIHIYKCEGPTLTAKERRRVISNKDTCPSLITAMEIQKTQEVRVEYWNTHTGHEVGEENDELQDAINSVQAYPGSYIGEADTIEEIETILEESQISQGDYSPDHQSDPETSSKFQKLVAFKKEPEQKKTSSMYSLASVACGKIKPVPKPKPAPPVITLKSFTPVSTPTLPSSSNDDSYSIIDTPTVDESSERSPAKGVTAKKTSSTKGFLSSKMLKKIAPKTVSTQDTITLTPEEISEIEKYSYSARKVSAPIPRKLAATRKGPGEGQLFFMTTSADGKESRILLCNPSADNKAKSGEKLSGDNLIELATRTLNERVVYGETKLPDGTSTSGSLIKNFTPIKHKDTTLTPKEIFNIEQKAMADLEKFTKSNLGKKSQDFKPTNIVDLLLVQNKPDTGSIQSSDKITSGSSLVVTPSNAAPTISQTSANTPKPPGNVQSYLSINNQLIPIISNPAFPPINNSAPLVLAKYIPPGTPTSNPALVTTSANAVTGLGPAPKKICLDKVQRIPLPKLESNPDSPPPSYSPEPYLSPSSPSRTQQNPVSILKPTFKSTTAASSLPSILTPVSISKINVPPGLPSTFTPVLTMPISGTFPTTSTYSSGTRKPRPLSTSATVQELLHMNAGAPKTAPMVIVPNSVRPGVPVMSNFGARLISPYLFSSPLFSNSPSPMVTTTLSSAVRVKSTSTVSSTSSKKSTSKSELQKKVEGGVPPGSSIIYDSSGSMFMVEEVDNTLINSMSDDPRKMYFKVGEDKRVAISPIQCKNPKTTKPSEIVKSLLPKKTFKDEDVELTKKVKFYQMEMKYLNSQEECKKLKLELAKLKLKFNGSNEQDKDESKAAEETFKAFEERPWWPQQEPLTKDTVEVHLNKGSEGNDQGILTVYTMVRTSMLRNLHTKIQDLTQKNKQLTERFETLSGITVSGADIHDDVEETKTQCTEDDLIMPCNIKTEKAERTNIAEEEQMDHLDDPSEWKLIEEVENGQEVVEKVMRKEAWVVGDQESMTEASHDAHKDLDGSDANIMHEVVLDGYHSDQEMDSGSEFEGHDNRSGGLNLSDSSNSEDVLAASMNVDL